ncbi:MAG: Gfo/Idh/MocA family oxidoreductase [Thermodesulfobacteriota bacterium]|nr:Gfo/Idh/MocA family oxidoreductase [Thermodesulfobacteriota bacterium]
MSGTIRVGVVGVGYLGKFHAEKYSKMNDVKLVGVVDVVKERADQIACQFNTRSFHSHLDLLKEIDAVSIVVPTEFHFMVSRDFIVKGIHTMIEKPITKNVDEAEELTSLAKKSGAIIQVGHLERFNPAVVALCDYLEHPLFIETHRLSSFKDRGTDVDVILDMMIHDIEIILCLVKSPVLSIDAVGVPVVTKKVDIANARLKFENGCVANITASRISDKEMRKIRVFQSDSYLSADCLKNEVTGYRRIEEREGAPPTILPINFETHKVDPLEDELRCFIDSVWTHAEPRVSGEDGTAALKIACEITKRMQ